MVQFKYHLCQLSMIKWGSPGYRGNLLVQFVSGSANLPLHKGKGIIFSMCFPYYTYLMCFLVESLEKKNIYIFATLYQEINQRYPCENFAILTFLNSNVTACTDILFMHPDILTELLFDFVFREEKNKYCRSPAADESALH